MNKESKLTMSNTSFSPEFVPSNISKLNASRKHPPTSQPSPLLISSSSTVLVPATSPSNRNPLLKLASQNGDIVEDNDKKLEDGIAIVVKDHVVKKHLSNHQDSDGRHEHRGGGGGGGGTDTGVVFTFKSLRHDAVHSSNHDNVLITTDMDEDNNSNCNSPSNFKDNHGHDGMGYETGLETDEDCSSFVSVSNACELQLKRERQPLSVSTKQDDILNREQQKLHQQKPQHQQDASQYQNTRLSTMYTVDGFSMDEMGTVEKISARCSCLTNTRAFRQCVKHTQNAKMLLSKEKSFLLLWFGVTLIMTVLYAGPGYVALNLFPSAVSHAMTRMHGFTLAAHELIPERATRWLQPSNYDVATQAFSYDWRSGEHFVPPDQRQELKLNSPNSASSSYSLPKMTRLEGHVPKLLPPTSDDVVRIMRQLANDQTSHTWQSNPHIPEQNKFPLTREAIDNAAQAEGNCVIVQIIKGKVYITSPNEDRYQLHVYHEQRRMETIRWVRKLLELQTGLDTEAPSASPMSEITQTLFPWSRKLRDDLRSVMSRDKQFWLLDSEFALCVTDYPTTQNPFEPVQIIDGEPVRKYGNRPSAAFNHITCGRRSGNVGIPLWNVHRLKGFENWANIIDEMTLSAYSGPAWDARKSKALFRGETRQCYATRDDFTVPMTYSAAQDHISRMEGSPSNPLNSLMYRQAQIPNNLSLKPILVPFSRREPDPDAMPVSTGGPNNYIPTTSDTWKFCGRTRLGYLSTLDDDSPTSETAMFIKRYLASKGKLSIDKLTPASADKVTPLKSMLDVALGEMPPYMRKAGVQPLEKNFIPMRKWSDYKFMLAAEGNAGWSDRVKTQAFMNVALILQDSMCQEWYVPMLEPWVHYIPTDYHWNNLHSALLWSSSPDNQIEVQQMIENMNLWAHSVLSPEATELYMREAINSHAKRLAFPVTLRPGAETVEDYFTRMNGLVWLSKRGHHETSEYIKKRPIFWVIVAPIMFIIALRLMCCAYLKYAPHNDAKGDSLHPLASDSAKQCSLGLID